MGFFVLGLLLGAGGAAAWLLVSWKRPIKELLDTADKLAKGEQARAKTQGSGELARLGATLNLLAERFQHDISELKRLEQVRKEFVANVSHELRTPLATIKSFAETLVGGAIEDKDHRIEFVAEIEKASDRMTRLVDDLLELSALESGKMPPNFEKLSLQKIAAEVTASLMPLAGRKQIVLRLEPFHDIPEVRADRDQLKQVFTNLLDNAIKFSGEKATVRISAQAAERGVCVSISDTGVGIPQADLPRVFERFYRVDKARSREAGGTGLGLAIVKHIVELHGGSVSVESAPGAGSTFRFTLPRV
jgi:two-component system phosphate regulon sensor histidine kinase PhoR